MATTHAPPSVYRVTCGCGVKANVAAHHIRRTHVCAGCGRAFRVQVTSDPITGETRARAVPPLPAAPDLPPRRPRSEVLPGNLLCECGSYLVVSSEQGRGVARCPGCGAEKEVAPPPQREPPKILTLSTGTEGLLCPCGSYLQISAEDWGEEVECPGCRTQMILAKFRDPQTLETLVRAIIIGKRDASTDSWSLDDFE